jgi:RTX calcium-binding nonapeptide repeat (4 copies)
LLNRGMAGPLALAALLTLVIAFPVAGHAAVAVQVTPTGELRADDYRGEPDKVDIRFEPVAVSGTVDRFVVENTAGAAPLNATCTTLVSPNSTACNAATVTSIGVGLSLGDDVVALASTGVTAIPAVYGARINGGEGNDVLKSAGGDDRLLGDAGGDILAGGVGDDDLAGGSGSDGLIGFEGDDILSGGPGKDALFGQKGRDSFKGGTGNDVLLARDRRRDELIDCGPGSLERAVRDRIDPRAHSCPPPKGRGKKRPGR